MNPWRRSINLDSHRSAWFLFLVTMLTVMTLAAGSPAWASNGIDLARADATADAEALFLQGRELFQQESYAQAAQLFADALRMSPGHPHARLYLQSAQRRLGDDAIDIAAQPSQADPVIASDSQAQRPLIVGRELADADDPEAIQARADEHYREANRHFRRKEYDQAKAQLQRVQQLAPDHAQGNALLQRIVALELEEQERVEQAQRQELERQAEAETRAEQQARREQIAYLLREAGALRGQGEFAKARANCERVLELDPDNRDARRELGRIEQDQARAQGAQEAQREQQLADEAQEAARAVESQVNDLVTRAQGAHRQGDYAAARGLLDQADRLSPNHAASVQLRQRIDQDEAKGQEEAAARAEQAAQEQAEQEARRAQQARQQEAAALLDRADAAVRDARFDDARTLLAQAAALDADQRAMRRIESRLERDSARATVSVEQAQAQARQAQARERQAQARELMREADSARRQGDLEQAEALLAQAEELDPELRGLDRVASRVETDAARATVAAQEAAAQAREAQVQSLVDQADGQARDGDFEQARLTLRQALDVAPGHSGVLAAMERVGQEEAHARDAAAQARVAQAEAERQQQLEDTIQQARAALDRGSLSQAQELADQAQYMSPESRDVQRLARDLEQAQAAAAEEARIQAQALAQRQAEDDAAQREDEARAAAQREAEYTAAQVEAHLAGADAALGEADYDAAIAGYQDALALDPNHRQARRQLSRAQQQAERAARRAPATREESVSLADGGTQTYQEAEERTALGRRYFDEGRYDDALREFQRVLELEPDNPLARTYVERIRTEMASGAATQYGAPFEPVAAYEEYETYEEYVAYDDDTFYDEAAPLPVEAMSQDEHAALARGQAFYNLGQLDDAQAEFQAVLAINPNNSQARQYLERVATDRGELARVAQAQEAQVEAQALDLARTRANELHDYALQLYYEGDVIGAHETWQSALETDPANATVRSFVENTADEYEQATQHRDERRAVDQLDTEYEARMNQPMITIEFKNQQLEEVLTTLGTITGFNIVAGDGVTGYVTLNIVDKSLREVLDMVLNRYGFGWEREANDIFIRPAHITRVFQLTEEQYNKLRRILSDPNVLSDPSQALQFILFPETGSPEVQGRLLSLNDKTLTLTVVDSPHNVALVEQFLSNIPPLLEEREPLLNRQYVLNPDTASKVFNLIALALYGDVKLVPTDPRGRMLLLDSETNILILKDSKENVDVVEQILTDQQLMEQLEKDEVTAKQFRITEDLDDTPEAEFRRGEIMSQTAAVLEVMLYGPIGKQEAIHLGRRMFVNENKGTIDIIDTPANIRKVEHYLQSVIQETDETVKITRLPIRHADPFYVARFVGQFLLGSTQGARRIHINETFTGHGVTRARSGRGTGTAGGGTPQFVNPTQRGAREPSTEGLGTIPPEMVGDAYIIVEPNSASLMVMSNEQFLLSQIITLVEFLDVRPRQVEIESRLIQVDLNEARERGGSILLSFQEGLRNIGDVGDFLGWPGQLDFLQNNQGQTVLQLQSVGGKTTVDFIFQILNTLTSAEILSAPKIISMSAPDFVPSIHIITSEPFISSAEFDDRGDDDPTNNRIIFELETEPVGIQLSVYPIITGDDTIYLEVFPSISVITGRLPVVVDFGQASDVPGALNIGSLGVPVIDRRQMFNQVIVPDGGTVIMGGLTRDELVESVRRTPGLSQIPLLGSLFRQTSKTMTKSTLLIFVTANIIKE